MDDGMVVSLILIPLANSPAGAAALENSLLLLLFASEAGKQQQ
jgi:hypothetical protein